MKLRIKKAKNKKRIKDAESEFLPGTPSEHAATEAVALGFNPFRNPKGLEDESLSTEFSTDLADVENPQLGKLHACYTSLTCYAASMATNAEGDLMEAETIMKAVHDVILTDIGSEEKQHVSKAQANTHPKFIEAQARYLKAKSLYNRINTSFDNYDRCAKAVSREITRRANDFDNLRRESNIK